MHILVATDNNYVPQLATLLVSIAERGDCPEAFIHVAYYAVDEERLRLLRSFAAGLFPGRVRFVHCDLNAFGHFRLDEHITRAAYIRIFLGDLLPPDVEAVLYLDTDTIIRRSIRPLKSVQLGDAALAAVDEPFSADPGRLNLDSEHTYFNSGVMLIDVSRWRAEDTTRRLLGIIDQNPLRLRYHDQDALNIAMQGRVLKLGYEWNFQARTTASDLQNVAQAENNLSWWKRNARIVHFTTGSKPWVYYHDIPFEGEYVRMLKRTPWATEIHRDKIWRLVGRRYLRRHAPLLVPLAKRRLGPADV